MFSFELEEIPAYAGMAMFKTRSALRWDLFSFQGAGANSSLVAGGSSLVG